MSIAMKKKRTNLKRRNIWWAEITAFKSEGERGEKQTRDNNNLCKRHRLLFFILFLAGAQFNLCCVLISDC